MKNSILILLLILSTTAFAQQEEKLNLPIDPETQKIKFQEVVHEQGTKQELFNRCVYWLYKYYKDPDRVLSIRDPHTGKIAGQHRFRVYYWDKDSTRHIGGTIDYTFTIEFRDGRYRYTINKLLLKTASKFPVENWLDKNSPDYDPRWDSYLKQISEFINKWIDTLKENMKPEKPKKTDDDW